MERRSFVFDRSIYSADLIETLGAWEILPHEYSSSNMHTGPVHLCLPGLPTETSVSDIAEHRPTHIAHAISHGERAYL